jgi:hypothetical protein
MKKVVVVVDLNKLGYHEIDHLRKKVRRENLKEISSGILDNGMVDIFDFKKYAKEFKFLGQYFSGLERYLRAALLIDYKYNHLSHEGREALSATLDKKVEVKQKREFLINLLDSFESRYILYHFYRHHAPYKSVDEIEQIYEKYESISFCTMFNCMYRVYVDKNWKNKELWF